MQVFSGNAEDTTVVRVCGWRFGGNLAIVDNQVFATVEREGWFSNKYSRYAITPYEKPRFITSYRGHYMSPVAYNNELFIEKYNAYLFSGYIDSLQWCTHDSDGSIRPFDILQDSESEDVHFYVTNFMLYKSVRVGTKVDHVLYYWNSELQDWCETGIPIDAVCSVYDSVVIARKARPAEWYMFDPVTCEHVSLPKFYDKYLYEAILYEDRIIYVDRGCVGSYNMTTSEKKTIYEHEGYPRTEDGRCTIFREGENIFFAQPNTKEIIRYDLTTDEIYQTKGKTINVWDFVVVDDWVYSVKEDDESKWMYVMISKEPLNK